MLFRLRDTIAALAVLSVSGRAAAQSVTVEVVTETGAKPIPGALVSLQDRTATVVKRTLADERGRVVLVPATAGRYRVRVDGIGYQGVTTDWFELAAGEAGRLRVVLTGRPLDLGELVVTSKRRVECRLDPEEGTIVARLWSEARKALLATQLTSAQAPVLDLRRYERDLDAQTRIRTERAESTRTASRRPFVSADPELLHRQGYVERGEVDTYHAPDADLLLSERFLEDHCFEVAPARPTDPPNAVGLRFEPTDSRRNIPEIGGVLWLDRTSVELRFLEFAYRNVELPAEATGVGGRVRFGRLANGGWIVDDWQIRMPRIWRRRLLTGGRDSLMGFREAGGSAVPAGAATVDPRSIALTGMVTDSTSKVPVPGVRVSIQAGAYADTTDSTGRYRIRAPAVGHYAVTFAHPLLRLLGLDSLVRGARLERGREDSVDVVVPIIARTIAQACPGLERTADLGVLFGRVADSTTGAPIPDAVVRINASTIRLLSGSVVSQRGVEYEARTDADGYFRACSPPVTGEIKVTGTRPDGRGAVTLRMPSPRGRIQEIELLVH